MKYPLLQNAFTKEDLKKGSQVLNSGKITMSHKTLFFEKKFAKKVNSKFSLMTNSGSSANLLSVAVACNPMRKKYLKPNDEVIIPSVCWSTSLWPLVQYNLKPIFVDVNTDTLNIDITDLNKKITKKTKAIMCVHILGMSTDMSEINKIVKKNKLILFEDTCESLGSQFNNKKLGTFGDFGTFSFYYSHQITSGEGGMVVCKNKNDYNILKCMRSHGWSRSTDFHDQFKKKFHKIDERFLFINSGYNLRPLDITAAIANNQLKRLSYFIKTRNLNRKILINTIKSSKRWNNQFIFVEGHKKNHVSWFGMPIMINKKYKNIKKKFLSYLIKNKIENRPIVSGNFLNQPSIKLYDIKTEGKFKGAQEIEDMGFFIGLHTKKLSLKTARYISNKFLDIDQIK